MVDNTPDPLPEPLHKVARAGDILGDFTRVEIKDNLRLGQFLPTDHVWAPGAGRWILLSELKVLSGTPQRVSPQGRPALPEATATQAKPATGEAKGFLGSIGTIFTWIFVLMAGGLIGAILEGRNPRRHPENDPLHDPDAGRRSRDYDDPYA